MISEGAAARVAHAVGAAALASAGLFAVGNPDTFGHLAQGRQIAELGHVPQLDPFSIWKPEPAPWANYEWLSDILTWWTYQAGGYGALLGLKCALLALSGALLVQLAQRHGGPRAALWCALWVAAAIPASRFRLSVRPHLIALPAAALYLLGHRELLDPQLPRRRATTWLAGLTLAHVAWVNLHGSHLLGLGLSGIAALLAWPEPTARRRLVLLALLQAGASCVSPYGPRILVDAIEHVLNPVYRDLLQEWGGASDQVPTWIAAAPWVQGALLLLVARPAWNGGPAARALWLGNAVMCVMALRSVRFVAEFLLLSSPLVAMGFSTWCATLPWRRMLGAVATASVALSLAVPLGAAQLPPMRPLGTGNAWDGLPQASGRWLAAHQPQARLLAAIEDAWFVMFTSPQVRFVQDGRVPFYGPEHIRKVQKAMGHPAHLFRLVDDLRVDSVLVQHTSQHHRAILAALQAHPDWKLATVEDRHALFVQRATTPLPQLLRPSYDPAPLLAASEDDRKRWRKELAALVPSDSNRGYRGWTLAVLDLVPLHRGGPDDGLRAATSAQEQGQITRSLGQIEVAAQRAGGVPIVDAYHAMVATLACDIDGARRALRKAEREGQTRHTLLTGQQLALREGRKEDVLRFIAQAEGLPRASGDPWLADIKRESTSSAQQLCAGPP